MGVSPGVCGDLELSRNYHDNIVIASVRRPSNALVPDYLRQTGFARERFPFTKTVRDVWVSSPREGVRENIALAAFAPLPRLGGVTAQVRGKVAQFDNGSNGSFSSDAPRVFKQRIQGPRVHEVFLKAQGGAKVEGTCAPRLRVLITIDGKIEQTVTCNGAGRFMVEIDGGLGRGDHRLLTSVRMHSGRERSGQDVRVFVPDGYLGRVPARHRQDGAEAPVDSADRQMDWEGVPPISPEVRDYAESLAHAASERFTQLTQKSTDNGANSSDASKSENDKKKSAGDGAKSAATSEKKMPAGDAVDSVKQFISKHTARVSVPLRDWMAFSRKSYYEQVVSRLAGGAGIDGRGKISDKKQGGTASRLVDIPLPVRPGEVPGYEAVRVDISSFFSRGRDWVERSYGEYREKIVEGLQGKDSAQVGTQIASKNAKVTPSEDGKSAVGQVKPKKEAGSPPSSSEDRSKKASTSKSKAIGESAGRAGRDAAQAKKDEDRGADAKVSRDREKKLRKQAKEQKRQAKLAAIAKRKALLERERQRKAKEKRAAEAKKKAEQEKRAAEAKKKAEQEKRTAEAKKKAEQEKRAAEAKKKAEQEKRAAEAKKKAEQEKRAAEAKKKAEQEKRAAVAKKQAQEQERIARKKRAVAAKKKAEEEKRKAASEKLATAKKKKSVKVAQEEGPSGEDNAAKAARSDQDWLATRRRAVEGADKASKTGEPSEKKSGSKKKEPASAPDTMKEKPKAEPEAGKPRASSTGAKGKLSSGNGKKTKAATAAVVEPPLKKSQMASMAFSKSRIGVPLRNPKNAERDVPDGRSALGARAVKAKRPVSSARARSGRHKSSRARLRKSRRFRSSRKSHSIAARSHRKHRVSKKKRHNRGRSHMPRRYTVRRGDSLWKIAKRYYGSGRRYGRICRANRRKISNPDMIYPGQRLRLPRR